MNTEFRKLSDKIGVEAIGVDLSKMPDSKNMEQIEKAFVDNCILLFRNQQLTEDQHVAFSKHFGGLEIHVLKQYLLTDYPQLLRISNIQENGKNIGISDAGQYWHTDLSYTKTPSRCSVLLAKIIPDAVGGTSFGDTCFINTIAAYEDLDEETKTHLLKLKAVHSYSDRYEKMRAASEGASQRAPLTEDQKKQVPDVTHPVIRTHPVSGKKSIYVNEGFTTQIEGLSADESDRLLKQLFEHCISEKFMYRHKWKAGDMVMWDNCSTQHLAIADYGLHQLRLMHRTTVTGTPVF